MTTIKKRKVTLAHVVAGSGYIIEGATVSLPAEPFAIPAASDRSETEPPRFPVMQHPVPRCHPLVAAAIEAMQ